MSNALPLSGVRVLDLGRMFAAPWAAQILGDLGADVIKVERPTGDEMRHYGPPYLRDADGNELVESAYTVACNRNKRSIAVDLGAEEGVRIVRELALKSDILIENFKAGDLVRRGLDYASLKALKPELVYLSVTGFGQTGPYAKRPAVDAIAQAMGGIMSVTGEANGDPQRIGVVLMDMMTGLYAAISALAALRHREINRADGQYVDLALLDTAMSAMSHRTAEWFLTGNTPKRRGNGSAGNVPANIFPCKDGTICVQAGGDVQFKNLCRALDRMNFLDDERFNTRRARMANEAALMEILNDIFRTRTVAEWTDTLVAHNVYCAPIYDVAQSYADTQVQHRQIRRKIKHPRAGEIDTIASPMRFSDTPVAFNRHPPMVGEHTDEILRDILGYEVRAIDELRRTNVIR